MAWCVCSPWWDIHLYLEALNAGTRTMKSATWVILEADRIQSDLDSRHVRVRGERQNGSKVQCDALYQSVEPVELRVLLARL